MTETSKSEILKESTSWWVSEVKHTRYTSTWTINDFYQRYKDAEPGTWVASPPFSTSAGKNIIQFNIGVYPKVSILLNVRGSVTKKCLDYKLVDSITKRLGYKEVIVCDELFLEKSDVLPNGNFTLYLEMELQEEFQHMSGSKGIPFKVPENQVLLNLGDMFDSQKFGDVVFVASGQEINAYKGILSAHSSVFAAMFEHKMKESEENRVEVTEMDPKVLKETLRFVHTGETSKLDEMAEDLLAAAAKYDLKRLKVLCEGFLFSKLSIETAASILMLSDRHNADELKSSVSVFICLHAAAVMDTEGWATLVNEQPKLMNEVLQALVLQNIVED